MNKNKVHVKAGDTVVILSGKYENKFDKSGKRKEGKVLEVSPKEGKVIVEGLNLGKKHVKPRKMGQPGGIIEVERPLHACKVKLVCPKCGKPTRIGHKILSDGSKLRQCKHKSCGEAF